MAYDLSLLEVSPAKAKQFERKHIDTVEDLISFFPRKYLDLRRLYKLDELEADKICLCGGTVFKKVAGNPNKVTIRDGADFLNITLFGTYWFSKIQEKETYYFYGKVTEYHGYFYMNNPVVSEDLASVQKILPIYSNIKGMSTEYLEGKIAAAISFMQTQATFDEKSVFAKTLNLMSHYEAVREIHSPAKEETFKAARTRIAFENIYDFYATLKARSRYKMSAQVPNVHFTVGMQSFCASLPFTLTEGQRDTLYTLSDEMRAGTHIHSMICGDVGCGKTIVAIALALLLRDNGYQSAVMAPTLVLAKQHLEEFQKYYCTLENAPTVALLTGETKKKERKEILMALKNGKIDVLIGTHAILASDIEFSKLGLTIVDEEHKFGTQQKVKMEERSRSGAHHISLSATPIPRSLASSIYTDKLSVLPIETMPIGRKPVVTTVETQDSIVFDKISEEIKKGHQAYCVCPFIEESESENFKDVAAVNVVLEQIRSYYKAKGLSHKAECISGDMKQAKILETIEAFAKGEFDVLISTTIVEVGVNIPNATAIAIMSANRFGLSALHQLRGRVGRKGDQGYCYLVVPPNMGAGKLQILCQTNNGFQIAEEDLRLRGPGDIIGDAQTGDSAVIELIIKRPKLSKAIRDHIFG